MQGKTMASLIMVGVAVLMIAGALFTKSWYSKNRGDMKFGLGLQASEFCYKGECKTHDYELDQARRDEDKLWMLFGMATFYFGLLNLILLAVAAVMTGIKSGSAHILARIGLFTTIFLLLLGGMFLALKPSAIRADPGLSAILFNLGCILGIVGTALGWSKIGAMAGPPMGMQPGMMPGQPIGQAPYNPAAAQQPMAQQPMAQQPMAQQPMAQQPMAQQPMAQQPMAQQPMAQQPAQGACPTCGQATRYIPEYQRNYCDTCQQYV